MKKDITELFCVVDDFCRAVGEQMRANFIEDKSNKRGFAQKNQISGISLSPL